MEKFRVKIAGSEEIVPILREPKAIRKELRQLRWKKIYAQCYARNAMRATRCRKCGSRELRPKAKEAPKEYKSASFRAVFPMGFDIRRAPGVSCIYSKRGPLRS
jgi:large subunit ribosomal protein L40e